MGLFLFPDHHTGKYIYQLCLIPERIGLCSKYMNTIHSEIIQWKENIC